MPVKVSWLCLAFLLASAARGRAEWSASATGNLFYTDDVALFSATRRLNLHGDPMQPVLDTSLTGKGLELSFQGQAFVYAVNPRFNHGSFGVQALHHIDPATRVRLRYYSTPNLSVEDYLRNGRLLKICNSGTL
ncbi:MAG TPA: hypothetical protein VJ805_05425 [Nitrospiraceae bacterium]|nr:hypothetical protein [Nitrospiraceae bacterium]